MAKIVDGYWKWLAEQLSWENKVIFLGLLIWLKWCEDLHAPKPNLTESALWYTSPVFFLVGLVGDQYYRLSKWWSDRQIRWVFWILG
jgi:hypothetical protein